MNATTRGITDHELAWMIETTHQRLNTMGITGPLADRIALILVMGACGDGAERARGVADRFFPVVATRLAMRPEGTANEPEPTRQA